MTKRMLIDATQPEETRVVVVDGNRLEDVEFETTHRRQIKGNIYLGRVMRVEPSLQACFVDYGGNKHGFLAFGEVHPDYYDLPAEEIEEIEKEVDEIIENKKQAIREREAERERIRQEKAAARAALEAERLAKEAENSAKAETEKTSPVENEENALAPTTEPTPNIIDENIDIKKKPQKKRLVKKRIRKQEEARKD
ncbi:MAG: ribonuclease E/G, partial [Alphaproteobacteria bacterium]|nr:ribonuclease E/G [Alphaproteobacteria bacterium]